MTKILTLVATCLFLSSYTFGQQKEDSQIVITISDTTDIQQKIKIAFIRNNFVIKELPIPDTISTYPQDYNGIYVSAYAIVSGNTVTISGQYTLKKVNYLGYNNQGKESKRIIYAKGNKTWRLLMKVAVLIGDNITYKE